MQLAYLAEKPQLPATMIVKSLVGERLPFAVIDAMRKALHSKETTPGNELRIHVVNEYLGFHDLANYQVVRERMHAYTLLNFLQQHTDSPDYYLREIADNAAQRIQQQIDQDTTTAELHSFAAVLFASSLVDWEQLANELLEN